MSLINLYGRNPDVQDTSFDYPSGRMPLRVGPPRYFTLPTTRVFAGGGVPMLELEDTNVALDPTSSYSYTRRGFGLGGLGAEQGTVRQFSNEFLEFSRQRPAAMYAGLAALTLLTLGAFKVFSRLAS